MKILKKPFPEHHAAIFFDKLPSSANGMADGQLRLIKDLYQVYLKNFQMSN
jgi:hypothetical protein